MSLSSGTRLGPYEVVGPLGAGGMGAVYRATDTRLNRTVAIKAMHASGALDPDHVARFEREAQLLASLNHPNIAAIHGLETVEDATYLVLEFVDGRPLSEVLREGPLPLDEALAIARQIADALAATHERGIIHRDLKPGNVMVTADGQVKVLDFGLGKTLDSGPGTQDSNNSPTMTMAATQAGIILGTAGYMSPEQAKGRDADKRSDVWAFGCVLFEMLSGRRAFEGEDITETLAAIVRGEPEWSALPAATPPAIRRLIERCLVKNRAERMPDMSVVRFVLNEPAVLGQPAPAVTRSASSRRAWMVAGAATGLAVLSGALWAARPGPESPIVASLTIDLPDGDFVTGGARSPVAISPDGTHVAYNGVHNGKLQLLVRALDDPQPKALEGTDGAEMPFFDPTGRWVAFFAQGQLKKITVGGSGLSVIAGDVPYPRGGCWGAGDTIYFAPASLGGIHAVPASGGAAQAVTELDTASGEITHRWPQILPDGKTLLFTAWTGPGIDERNVAVQTLGTGGHRVIVPGGETGRYVDGYLMYGRLDTLFAVPWRPGQDLGAVEPVELAQHVRGDSEGHAYAVSDTGTLAYLQGSPRRYESRVVWVDRSGRAEALQMSPGNYEVVSLSPRGDRAVVQINGGLETLWMYDVSRGTLAPFLTPEGSSQSPVWTPDGQYVIYRGTRAGQRNMYRKRADGVGGEERLTTEPGVTETPVSVSPDGRWLVFAQSGGSGGSDLLALDFIAPAGSPARPVANLPAAEGSGRVSPDGHWVLYVSAKSGKNEIYVQAFPDPGPVYTVSTDGGREPLWSRDGREIFYVPLSGDGLMVANVTPGSAFKASQPRVLFTGYYKPSIHSSTGYDISPDGRQFVKVQPAYRDGAITRIEVVLNWLAGFRAGGNR